MRCRDAIRAELARRQQINSRYSLRRFARSLGVHHATLSRLLRGRRPLTARTTRALCRRLAIAEADITRMIGFEEAAAVADAIAEAACPPGSRRLAVVTGIPVDNVNIALHALLRDGILRMPSARTWVVTRGAHA